MTLELNKDELVTLVKGLEPSYILMNKYSKMGLGDYIGGFVDRWTWDKYGLQELTEEELYNIFQECKK